MKVLLVPGLILALVVQGCGPSVPIVESVVEDFALSDSGANFKDETGLNPAEHADDYGQWFRALDSDVAEDSAHWLVLRYGRDMEDAVASAGDHVHLVVVGNPTTDSWDVAAVCRTRDQDGLVTAEEEARTSTYLDRLVSGRTLDRDNVARDSVIPSQSRRTFLFVANDVCRKEGAAFDVNFSRRVPE